MKGKLAPRYVGPFEILKTCGPVAYRLQLPFQLAAIHNIFHVSQLKKCIKIPTEVINFQTIKIEPDLSYTERPIQIVRMFKIQWNHHTEEEVTWETESYLQHNFPDFLRAKPSI
jgi:hypothetical protein